MIILKPKRYIYWPFVKHGHWHAVIYDIAQDKTAELEIENIIDISYSFGKTIQTRDISIDNYHQF